MALISEIRKRSWLVFIFIGLALVGFLLMDSLNSSQGSIRGSQSQTSFAEIDGVEVGPTEYNTKYQEALVQYLAFNQLIVPFYSGEYKLDRATEFNLREEAWNNMVQEKLMKSQYEQLDLGLTEKEKENLIYGQEPHSYIKNYYVGLSQTGQYDPQALLNYVNYISDPNNRQAQLDVEQAYLDFIVREKLALRDEVQSKYLDLIQKAVYVPSWQAEQNYLSKNEKVNLDFIEFAYTEIPDSSVSVSDNEVKAYYDKNKEKYKQDESRVIEYVSFPIVPTRADSAGTLTRLKANFTKFRNTENDSSFIQLYSDDQQKFSRYNYTKEELYPLFPDSAMVDEAFAAEANTYMGPFYLNGYYKVAKVLGQYNMPDSAKARHILVAWPQSGDSARAFVKADSIRELLANGADFAALASSFSDDKTSGANGGDLGWSTVNNNFVKPFGDYIFKGGQPGELGMIKTRFGWHLIEIEEFKTRKDYLNVVFLSHKVNASAETEDSIDRVAGTFFETYNTPEKFNEGIAEYDLRKGISPPFDKNQYAIVGIPDSREIISWSYFGKQGDFRYFPMSDKYLIAYLAEVNEKGYKPLENARTEVEAEVIKEKKAKKIEETINASKKDGMDLNALAQALGKAVKNVPSVSLGNPYTIQLGQEPKVVGAAFGMELNTVSKPIAGTRGVFVIQPISKTPAAETTDYSSVKTQLRSTRQVKINAGAVVNMLKEKKKIVDNRYLF